MVDPDPDPDPGDDPDGDGDAAIRFNPDILASELDFGSGTPWWRRRPLSDNEIEDIVTQRQRGDGW